MTTPKAYQLKTEDNGALNLACQKAAPFVAAARAKSTRALYGGAWARWATWCEVMHANPLPASPEAVAAYLAELARDGKSVSTIRSALAAIVHYHREAGHPLDRGARAIATVMAGIARTSSRPIRRAAALELGSLRALIARIDGEDVRSQRDRALLLVAFFGALRRSELVALDVDGNNLRGRSSVEVRREGLLVHLTATKASAATQTVAIPRRADELCAAAAVERYVAVAGITRGPLFRAVSKAGRLLARRLEASSVRHILKARAGDSTFSPHSLRSGFITSAADANVPEHLIQRTSRHRSVETLRGYIRAGDPFECAARHL